MLTVYLNQEILVTQTKTVLNFFTLGQLMSCLHGTQSQFTHKKLSQGQALALMKQ